MARRGPHLGEGVRAFSIDLGAGTLLGRGIDDDPDETERSLARLIEGGKE